MRKLAVLLGMFMLFSPAFAFAQLSSGTDTGLNTAAGQAGFDTTSPESQSVGTFVGSRIITPLFALIGVIFMILIIYGGVLWMTGGGNPDTVKKAKSILVNSILGLLVILLAYGFTQFLFNSLT